MSPNGDEGGGCPTYIWRRLEKAEGDLNLVRLNRDDLCLALERAIELMNPKIVDENPNWSKQAKEAIYMCQREKVTERSE